MSHPSDQEDENEYSGDEFASSEIELSEPDDHDNSPPITQRQRDTLYTICEEEFEDEHAADAPGTAGRKRLKLDVGTQGTEQSVEEDKTGAAGTPALDGRKLKLNIGGGQGNDQSGVGDRAEGTPGTAVGGERPTPDVHGRDNDQSGIRDDTQYWMNRTLEGNLWQPGAEHTLSWEEEKLVQVSPELKKIKFRITSFVIEEATDKVPVYRLDDPQKENPYNVYVFPPNHRAGPPFHCPEVYDLIQFAKSLGIPVGSTSRVILKYEPPEGRGKTPPNFDAFDPPPKVYNPPPNKENEAELVEVAAPHGDKEPEEENEEPVRPRGPQRLRLWLKPKPPKPPTPSVEENEEGDESGQDESEEGEEDEPDYTPNDQDNGVDEDLSAEFGQGNRKLLKNFNKRRMKRLFPPKPPFRRMRTWAGRMPPKPPMCEEDDLSSLIVYKYASYKLLPREPSFIRPSWDAKGRPRGARRPSRVGIEDNEGNQGVAQESIQRSEDVDVKAKKEHLESTGVAHTAKGGTDVLSDGSGSAHIIDDPRTNDAPRSQSQGTGSVQILDGPPPNEPAAGEVGEADAAPETVTEKKAETATEKATEKAPAKSPPKVTGRMTRSRAKASIIANSSTQPPPPPAQNQEPAKQAKQAAPAKATNKEGKNKKTASGTAAQITDEGEESEQEPSGDEPAPAPKTPGRKRKASTQPAQSKPSPKKKAATTKSKPAVKAAPAAKPKAAPKKSKAAAKTQKVDEPEDVEETEAETGEDSEPEQTKGKKIAKGKGATAKPRAPAKKKATKKNQEDDEPDDVEAEEQDQPSEDETTEQPAKTPAKRKRAQSQKPDGGGKGENKRQRKK